ncbi:glycoside hydrolase family 105 protein [Echinicola sp. 20G]|uniref:glycoside hydrolase family 88/105 protein n=1 Tax=Echinicola sp. 20G TaxID=2781961 RepID=UPI0019109673|nr:glycoside hydrolase family 88 protein [Echinicola sp. 20G]
MQLPSVRLFISPGYFTLLALFLLFINFTGNLRAQEIINDSNTPLHLIQPDYSVPYGEVSKNNVQEILLRVKNYLEQVTPAVLEDKNSGEIINDLEKANEKSIIKKGDFRLLSYEWGVVYAGMLAASEATGDESFRDYTFTRLTFLADLYTHYSKIQSKNMDLETPIDRVMFPHALDDAGAICAAMIKSQHNGLSVGLDKMIDNYIDFIMNQQFKLEDGTLARNRPLDHTLWLDDLFMSVPALAQMGNTTGEAKYFDEAVKQVLLFSKRMFNWEKKIYMHGWVEGSKNFPQYHWGRANGWAFMTLVELLDVLPESHPGREKIMEHFLALAEGLASYQSNTGLWHQLLDRKDSYLETSATAIYTYGFAKAINRGWLDYRVFGPLTILAWSGVSTKVNIKGQVEGTCVGTGMGFDPAFYFHRPISVYAAHGYGPVLLAGAEVYKLLENHSYEINETAVQFLE